MLRRVKITDVGDTNFLLEEQVEKWLYEEENNRVLNEGGRPGNFGSAVTGHYEGIFVDRILHFGILFPGDNQGTYRGLISGKVDHLRGLKENVIMGRLIPAGTGLPCYRNLSVETDSDMPEELKLQKMTLLRASSRA